MGKADRCDSDSSFELLDVIPDMAASRCRTDAGSAATWLKGLSQKCSQDAQLHGHGSLLYCRGYAETLRVLP